MSIEKDKQTQGSTKTGMRWNVYIGITCLIWLLFIWDGNTLVSILTNYSGTVLIDIARVFPGPNSKYLSLIEHGYMQMAKTYAMYFSINLIIFMIYFIYLVISIDSDEKLIKKHKNFDTMSVFILALVFIIILFIMENISYNNENYLVNYSIHESALYYYVDVLSWSGLMIVIVGIYIIIRYRIV